ncbi:signal peptide peptidase SppA [bacterium]|nr:signal peptide peptidase SppA [bacterium]MBU1653170.1 signal peptide peptidase SppA [bacterium]MBU1881345.1 signal peptide peptidase SppA [bacterium]
MSRRRDLFVLVFFILIFILLMYLVFGMMSSSVGLSEISLSSGEKVAIVNLIGPIYDSRPTLEQLDRVAESSAVKALVLRLETPGGALAASQEVYQRIAYLRDDLGIPVIASMGNVAASGGYYVALAADTIVANAGSITGSIGVVMMLPAYYDLLEKIGIDFRVIKSGKFKDTGSPYRSMSPDEAAYLQDFLDDGFQQFRETVLQERDITSEDLEPVADGRIFTGRQALELNLIDVIGGLDDAIRIAGEMGGIEGKPTTVVLEKKRKMTFIDLMFGDLEEIVFLKLGLGSPLRYEMPQLLP